MPDATILAIRHAHEVEHKSLRQVQAEFPDIAPRYVRAVLGYLTRTNLRLK